MPSSSIEALGRLISRQVAGTLTVPAPCSARPTPCGGTDEALPAQKRAPRPCAMQGTRPAPWPPPWAAPAGGLRQHLLPCDVLHALNIPPVPAEGLIC